MHQIPPGVACRMLTDSEAHHLSGLVGQWFAEHAEMDRARFLTLLDEAKAVSA